jgi:hypothetical protein
MTGLHITAQCSPHTELSSTGETVGECLGYSEDLEDLKWDELKAAIVPVEVAVAAKLGNFAGWLELLGVNNRAKAASWFQLPIRSLRPFLHYKEAPPWEGRYDTMYPAIQVADSFWNYLIEHRNN